MGGLALAAPMASAQTAVTQNTTNSAAVFNPAVGTNTIDLGGGGLGAGASVSTSAGGAVSSTSVTGINSHFVNPVGGFGIVIQGAGNIPPASVTNNGAIIGASGDAALGSSLSIGARGAASTFSIIGMGGIPFLVVANVGDIAQGFSATIMGSLPVLNDAPISNTGEIIGPTGGPALNLSGTGASASVSATSAMSVVSRTALGATGFTGTTFGQIHQVPGNSNTAGAPGTGVFNGLQGEGISLGAISGDGASVSATATGAAAGISFAYVNTTNGVATPIGGMFQNPTNSALVVNNANAGVSVGDISGDGASVRIGAAGATAGISFSSIGSSFAPILPELSIGGLAQIVVNNGNVSSFGNITSSGSLTGAGSSAVASTAGASASFSVSSIGDVFGIPVHGPGAPLGIFAMQQVTNTGVIAGGGQITLGTGSLANGAFASISSTGAQAAVSLSAINTTMVLNPFFSSINQTVTNQNLVTPANVSNSYSGITAGNLAGHGSSVSATASGATAAFGASFVNTAEWSAVPVLGVIQNVTNSGIITNTGPLTGGISVGDISGTGASVRASASGATASIALTSIQSGPPSTPPITTGLFVGSTPQTVTNNGVIINNASIVSTGTLSGIGSSAAITATGAAASVSVASINDTPVVPFTAQLGPITQTVTNNFGSVTNTGSITLAGGNLGVGAAASISAAGASASVSFLAVR
jgi:hypothetical protein